MGKRVIVAFCQQHRVLSSHAPRCVHSTCRTACAGNDTGPAAAGLNVASQVSHDADADDEEEGVQSSRGKKQAAATGAKQAAGKGRGRAAAAAATESVEVTEEGSEDGARDEEGPKGRRRSLAHLRAQLHEQVSSDS